MKTFVSIFALSLATCVAAGAAAQPRSAAPASAADSVLLSESTDGDYLVRRYMVKNRNDAGYSVRYRINLSQLNSTLDDNARELDALNAFVGNLSKDTLMHVTGATITGYASPDGPVKFNETLARNRALNFKSYLDRKYGFSKKYDVQVKSVAEGWAACREAVRRSSVPDKQAVLDILDGSHSVEAKQQALEKLPAAWDYLREHILPPMRRVELTIDYGENGVVEQRTLICRPAPTPAPTPAPEPECAPDPCRTGCCDIVVDESITGILVELPEPGEEDAAARKAGERVDDRRIIREARMAEAGARYDREDIARDVRQEKKELKKIARKEAKAAKAAEKAARKAAKKR